MQLTQMGYYNAVVYVSDPSNICDLFEPTKPGEEVEVIEDVEEAIKFLSDYFDADVFNSPRSAEELKNVHPGEIFQKAMILERLRFDILREDWEPVFDPYPHNPLHHYDPDVNVERKTIYVRVPDEDGNVTRREQVVIHDWAETYDDPDKYPEGRFWIDWPGINVQGDDIVEVADEFHDRIEEQMNEYISDQVGEKFIKLFRELKYESDIEVNLDQLKDEEEIEE